jgi:hypothetical protein
MFEQQRRPAIVHFHDAVCHLANLEVHGNWMFYPSQFANAFYCRDEGSKVFQCH